MNHTSAMETLISFSQESMGIKLNILKSHGQSTVEFLITFVFSLGILFLFIQLALSMTAGYMAHYATYMSSRTYLVMDNASQNHYGFAALQAKTVFSRFNLKRFLIKSDDFGINAPSDLPDRRSKLYVGTYFSFTQRVSLFSKIGGNKVANLVSESFLGKEPSRHQCLNRICTIMKLKIGYPSSCPFDNSASSHATFFDNGC